MSERESTKPQADPRYWPFISNILNRAAAELNFEFGIHPTAAYQHILEACVSHFASADPKATAQFLNGRAAMIENEDAEPEFRSTVTALAQAAADRMLVSTCERDERPELAS